MMPQLTEENCGEKVSLEEIKAVQLEMLDTLADYCEANELRYFLDGGTLLGAIRHNGYIPWDDDIDVMMPRPDCLRLQILTKGRLGRFIVESPYETSIKGVEIWRMYDPAYVIKSFYGGYSRIPYYSPVFLDIQVMEGMPEDLPKCKKMINKIYFYRSLLNSTVGSLWHGKTICAKIYHIIARPFAIMVGYNNIFNKMQEIKEQYDFDNSRFVGTMSTWTVKLEARTERERYTNYTYLDFENRKYRVPGNYVEYAEQVFGKGSTTQLPPLNKRKTHHVFEIYRCKCI